MAWDLRRTVALARLVYLGAVGGNIGLFENTAPTECRLPADQDNTGGSGGLNERTTTEAAVGEMRFCHVGLLMLGGSRG